MLLCKNMSLVTQSCPTLCDLMDHSLPLGSSVHGIFQTRTLVWFAYSFSRGSSWPRDRTQVPWTAGRFFTNWATREAHNVKYNAIKLLEEKVGENLHALCIWWWIFRYNTKNTIHGKKKALKNKFLKLKTFLYERYC